MIFAAHQPHYLPWLRYLHKIAAADVFVLLDDAQYTKNGWQNRTRVKGSDGAVLLTVPVHARLGERICDVRPAGETWRRRHLASLDACYGSALRPWRAQLTDILDDAAHGSLATLAERTISMLVDAFGIDTPVVHSSALGVDGSASDRLAAIGRALGADAYLTGAHALEAYLLRAPFETAGIDVVAQRWACPRYPQRFAPAGFIPDLSAIDLLVNQPGRPLEVLLSGEEVRGDPALAAHPGT